LSPLASERDREPSDRALPFVIDVCALDQGLKTKTKAAPLKSKPWLQTKPLFAQHLSHFNSPKRISNDFFKSWQCSISFAHINSGGRRYSELQWSLQNVNYQETTAFRHCIFQPIY